MIDEPVPVEAPGGFAPVFAIGTTDASGMLALVGDDVPLATIARPPQVPPPLEGAASAPVSVGPFVPAALVPVFLTLSGEWTGTVRLLRSVDGGTTKHPLTAGGSSWGAFSANACEPVWVESEVDAALYLELTPALGTIAYRLAQ